MDPPDNDEYLENPPQSSLDLDSYLNTLMNDISDDECNSIVYSQQITREEDKQPGVFYISSGKQTELLQFEDLSEDRVRHYFQKQSAGKENRQKNDHRTVVDELTRRRIDSCAQNFIVKCAPQTESHCQDQVVLQSAEKTTLVTEVQKDRNTRKRSYPFIDVTLDKGCYPSSSWPSESRKLRKLKHKSYSKQGRSNRACGFKLEFSEHENYSTKSQEIILDGKESLPEVSSYNREQISEVVSECLDTKIDWTMGINAAQSVYDASLSQESLFDDYEAVTCDPDEQIPMIQSESLSIAVTASLEIPCPMSPHTCVHQLCSKEKMLPREKTLRSLMPNGPRIPEQAVSPVALFLPLKLSGQAGVNCLSSVSSSPPQKCVQISACPSQVLNEACFQIRGARHAELCLIEDGRQTNLPMIEGAREAELPIIEGAREAELPIIEGAREAELPLIEGAREAELPLIKEAREAELPLIDGAREAELPLTEGARGAELPLIEKAKLPLIEKAKLPLTEDSRQAELILEVPLLTETRQIQLFPIKETHKTERPLTENIRQNRLSLTEKRRQIGQPTTDETRQSELSLTLEARPTELLVMEGTRQASELLVMEGTRQASELAAKAETRQTELCQIEEARHTNLSPITDGLNSVCRIPHEKQDTIPSVSENKIFLPVALSNEWHNKLAQENVKISNCQYLEESCSGLQLNQQRNVPGFPHELDVSIVPQYFEMSRNSVFLRKKETFFEATEIKHHKESSNECTGESIHTLKKMSAVDGSPERVISAWDRGTSKSQYKSLVCDNTGTFDCEYQEMPRSPPVLIDTEGVPYSLPSGDHVVPQCELTLSEKMTPNTGSVDYNTGVTDCVYINIGVIDGGVDFETGVSNVFVDNSTRVTDSGIDKITEITNSVVENRTEVTGGAIENSTRLTDYAAENSTGLTDSSVDNKKGVTDGAVENTIGVTDGAIENSTGLTDSTVIKSKDISDGAIENIIGVTDGAIENIIRVTDGAIENSTGLTDSSVKKGKEVTDGAIENIIGVTDGAIKNSTGLLDSNVGNSTGDDTCKDSKQRIMPYVQELHFPVDITESADNKENLSNQNTISPCTSLYQHSSNHQVLPQLHQSQEITSDSSITNDKPNVNSSENPEHSHHSEETSHISLEDSKICEEQKVPEAEPSEDLSLSEMSMYSDLPGDTSYGLKPKQQMKQVFQWNLVYDTAINKSLTDQSSDSVPDSLSAIVPIVHTHRPLRIGLSRKQKVKHLHNK